MDFESDDLIEPIEPYFPYIYAVWAELLMEMFCIPLIETISYAKSKSTFLSKQNVLFCLKLWVREQLSNAKRKCAKPTHAKRKKIKGGVEKDKIVDTRVPAEKQADERRAWLETHARAPRLKEQVHKKSVFLPDFLRRYCCKRGFLVDLCSWKRYLAVSYSVQNLITFMTTTLLSSANTGIQVFFFLFRLALHVLIE